MDERAATDLHALSAQRLFARAFVVLGGLFWVIAAFAAQYSFRGAAFVDSIGSAAVPFGITVGVFVLGLASEYVTSVLLFAGAGSAIAWGLAVGWEPPVWGVMAFALIGPTVIAGVLYLLAARSTRERSAHDVVPKGTMATEPVRVPARRSR